MAASRVPRKNAGANMANLIKDFHEEESFATLYGGFTEVIFFSHSFLERLCIYKPFFILGS